MDEPMSTSCSTVVIRQMQIKDTEKRNTANTAVLPLSIGGGEISYKCTTFKTKTVDKTQPAITASVQYYSITCFALDIRSRY